ncbi:MAG: CotH kinase family protein [Candidatus Melainabacteria bacterium]|nr:CotH kinase family protein [Candidatus Melainabacteria bacterium]
MKLPNNEVQPNLREGTILPSRAKWLESPFVVDKVFTKNESVEIYNSEGINIDEKFDHSFRFIIPAAAVLRVDANVKNIEKIPIIWLYDDENKLVSNGKLIKDGLNVSWLHQVSKEGFYKLRMIFNTKDIETAVLTANLKDRSNLNLQASEVLQKYFDKSVKTIELRIDKNQMKVFENLKLKQEEIWTTPIPKDHLWRLYPTPQGRFIARIRAPGKSSWSIASIGLSGRNEQHKSEKGILSSLDIKIASGELPYGLKKFKLYLLQSKEYLRDMLYESILRDLGLFMPRQDYVKVYINGKYYGFMELLENIDNHTFEYARRLEGPVLSYDSDAACSKENDFRLIQRNYFKKVKSKQTLPQISSSNFAESICRHPFLLALSYAFAYGGNHGLNQQDLRFHMNQCKGCFDPIIRDFNSGVNSISFGTHVLHTSFLNLGIFSPMWRPNSASHSANYLLKEGKKSKNTQDLFYLWSVMPTTLNFLENYNNRIDLDNYVTIWGTNWSKELVKKRFENAIVLVKVVKEYFHNNEPTTLLNSLAIGIRQIKNLPKEYETNYEISSSAQYIKDLISNASIQEIIVDEFSLKLLTWRNKNIEGFLNKFAPVNDSGEKIVNIGLNLNNVANVIGFLYRKELKDAVNLFFIQRKIVGEDDSSSFYLLDKDTHKVYYPKNIYAGGQHNYNVNKITLLLNIINPDELVKVYYFRIPKTNEFRYLVPVVKGDLNYLGIREYAILPKEEEIPKHYIAENASKYFDLNGSELRLKENIPVVKGKLNIPKGSTLVVDKKSKLKFDKEGCLEVQGLIKIADNASFTLTSDGESWNGVHFLDNDDLDIQNLKIKNVGNGSYNVICGEMIYTGGFSLYNTKAKISNLKIKNAMVEDALHLLNSEIELNNISISYSQSDAIDSDFSSLIAHNLDLQKNSGDGLDVSGSYLQVSQSHFSRNKDKSISIGENSFAMIENSQISKSYYGIALKDSSHLEIEKLQFNDCKENIAKYVKKPYFTEPNFANDNLSAKDLGFLPTPKR